MLLCNLYLLRLWYHTTTILRVCRPRKVEQLKLAIEHGFFICHRTKFLLASLDIFEERDHVGRV